MAVIQEAFDIPADIMTGLLTGEYRRMGGVVRWAVGANKGQIVKHLKPIDSKKTDAAKGVLAKGVELVKANPKAAVVVGAGTLIVGGGVIAYKKLKNREPAVLKEFRQALKIYLDAIRTESLDVEVIDNMSEALYALKQHKNYEKFSIQLTAEDIETLVNMIQDYTVKLAADNDIVLEDIEAEKSDDAIINLETYLNVQKRVFEEAA